MITTLLAALALQAAAPAPAWAALATGTTAALQAENVNAARYAALAKGEIVTERRPTPKDKTGVHVAAFALIRATPEAIFDAVADCPRLPTFMPHFVECSVIPADVPLPPNERYNDNKLEFGFFPVKVKIHIIQHATLDRPRKLSWARVRGDTKVTEGYWRTIALSPEATLLVYDTLSDPGTAVPEFIQRALTENDLPKTVEAVRTHVEDARGSR
jgi:ribosome-associated toxin RatA of RatAB toxin-antitoxin module